MTISWTNEQDEELVRLWPMASASAIGKELGKTRNAVIGRHHRLTKAYSRKPRASELQAKQLRQLRTIAIVEIAVDMEAQITRGLERNKAIAVAHRRGATLQHIGEVLGISRARVGQIVAQQKESVGAQAESR